VNVYADMIRAALANSKIPAMRTFDVKLVEHWMRQKFGVLDGLGKLTFGREAREGAKLVIEYPYDTALLAASMGMSREQIAKALGTTLVIVNGYFLKAAQQVPAEDAPFELFQK
jgi:hypothetical protein